MLNELLGPVKNNIPSAKKIMPIIRKEAASAIKDHVIPCLTVWLNSEMGKVIKGKDGSGLDFKTLTYIRDRSIKEAGKKNLKSIP